MELTDKQIAQQDYIDNKVFALLNELNPSGKELTWDIDAIGRIRDAIAQVFVDKGICTEQEFYPYIEE